MTRTSGVLFAVLVALTGGASCSCATASRHGAPGTTAGSSSGVPSFSSVANGRFVTMVDLDNGGFTVEPPARAHARVPLDSAEEMFRATDAVYGNYRFAVFGLGVVTIAPDVTAGVPTSTAPAAGGGGAPATPSSTSSTTTTASASTSSVPGGATPGRASATTEPSTAAPSAALPAYQSRLAWVGIAWAPQCPARTGIEHPSDVAVVFDAQSGDAALAYTSRGTAGCSTTKTPAYLVRPSELVSVPWQPVGPSSTAVRVSLPACATYFGWTTTTGAPAGVQVVARRPYDADCSPAAPTTQTVDDVVPLGSAQAQVPHAALGPVDGLRTLPSD